MTGVNSKAIKIIMVIIQTGQWLGMDCLVDLLSGALYYQPL